MTREATFALIDAKYAVLCLTDPDGRAYGVPLDYVREGEVSSSRHKGRKIDSMRANHWACAVIVGDTIIPKNWTIRVTIIEGPIELIDDPEQKRRL